MKLKFLVPIFVSITMIVGCSGCSQSRTEVTELPKIGTGAARIEADVDFAREHVERAKPYTNEVGKAELNGATFALDDGKKEIASLKVSLDTVNKQVKSVVTERDTAISDLKAERDHYLGYKTRVILKWLIIGTIVVWLLSGLAGGLLSAFGGGSFLLIGRQILHLLPFANPFVLIPTLFGKKVEPSPTEVKNDLQGT